MYAFVYDLYTVGYGGDGDNHDIDGDQDEIDNDVHGVRSREH
jgi:hypothetical protein